LKYTWTKAGAAGKKGRPANTGRKNEVLIWDGIRWKVQVEAAVIFHGRSQRGFSQRREFILIAGSIYAEVAGDAKMVRMEIAGIFHADITEKIW
jgi:hypothetical protein